MLKVSTLTTSIFFFFYFQFLPIPIASSEPILIKSSPLALNKILKSDTALGFESRVRDGQFIESVTMFRRKSGVLQYYNGKTWKTPSKQAILQKGYKGTY
jgi:hypothetical protein